MVNIVEDGIHFFRFAASFDDVDLAAGGGLRFLPFAALMPGNTVPLRNSSTLCGKDRYGDGSM